MNKGLLLLNAAAITLGFAVTEAQTVSVNEPDVCFMCHSEIETLLEKSHIHSAFKSGICSECHNPHASRHAGLLNDLPGAICLECHKDKEPHRGLLTGHRPVEEGDCLHCHDPHASDHPNQLKKPLVILCISCHPIISDWQKQPYRHPLVDTEDCLICHMPHGGNEPSLLTMPIPRVCDHCHEQDDTFVSAHSGYQLREANCITCHHPHASSLPALLMPNQHAPFKSKNCDACHAESGGSAFAMKTDIKTVCTKCHSAVNRIAEEPFAHILNDEQSCMHCHSPHASSEEALLSGSQTVICVKCHFTGREYAGKPMETILAHKGMDCSNCHAPHGSANELYFVKDSQDMCVGCHERAHQASHPVGPQVIDPRTGKSVTCLSCHQLHGADFDKYLPLNPEMDLCIQCHRE